jgi:hypothetical protein
LELLFTSFLKYYYTCYGCWKFEMAWVQLLSLTNICKRLHTCGLKVEQAFCHQLSHSTCSGFSETNIQFVQWRNASGDLTNLWFVAWWHKLTSYTYSYTLPSPLPSRAHAQWKQILTPSKKSALPALTDSTHSSHYQECGLWIWFADPCDI